MSGFSRRRETLRPSADVGQGEMAGRGRSKRRSRTGLARVCGDLRLAGWLVSCRRAPSGWEWNRSQPCQGATELGFPRPMLGKMQSEAARRAGELSRPAREKNRRRRVLVVAIRSPRPSRAVQRARLWAIVWTASQAALAAKRPEGRWFSPTPYLSRVSHSRSRRGGDGRPPVLGIL